MTSEVTRHRLPLKGVLVMAFDGSKAIAVVFVFGLMSGDAKTLLVNALTLLGFGVLMAVVGFLRWLRYEYWFEDGEFRVQEGLLSRKRTFIPLDKVQAVDVTSGLLQRLLGLVKLEIKTGASGSQATLSALTREDAERVRARLRPDDAQRDQAAPTDHTAASTYRLTPRQLMLAGATSGRIGVVAGGVAWLLSQFDELVVERVMQTFELDESLDLGALEALAQVSPFLVAAIAVGGLFVSWIGAVVWELLRYGNFQVSLRGDQLVVQRGVFEQRQITLPVKRVQAVRYHETILRQPFGHGTLYVETVGHGEEAGQSSTTLHPFISRAECRRLIADLVPQFDVPIDYVSPPRRALPRFFIKPTLIVALAVGVAAWLWTPAMAGAVVLPLVWWVAYVNWRDTGLSLGDEVAVVRGRHWLRRTTAILLRGTTQMAGTSASIFQRRRRLATVVLTVATGPVGRTFGARDLDETQAWRALQWVLPATPRVSTTPGTLPESSDALAAAPVPLPSRST